ncbi:MAG: hypothetical protein COA71_01790 [SAR86 cluster bacterium]|uniref:BrnT family toxin n=1 Tax=SAR86 cluster bacterium TaxID=2030880 RepID=A0A2A5CIC7_9GAMM|nr:MAG: hypothetical protein COA71_01790 [SAR86 cluster bacterium]
MTAFEWDSTKDKSNQKKHGISFDEAQSVFYDEYAIQFYDDVNSETEEDRFLLLGLSSKSQILMICHCERGKGEVVRIISARKATTKERKSYLGGSI